MAAPRRMTLWIALLIGFFVVHAFFQSLPALPGGGQQHNLVALPVAGALFCGLDAVLLLGWRRALAFILVSAVAGWFAEYLGVTWGLIFGSYTYGDVLGPKLGGVPITIPLFWFMLVYLSYVITNLITRDVPDIAGRATWLQDIWGAGVGGLVATAYDLGVDPYLSSAAVGAWTWSNIDPDTAYFGVPPSNFLGWIAVTAAISLFLRRLDHAMSERHGDTRLYPRSHLSHYTPNRARLIALIPVGFYLSFLLLHLGPDYREPVKVVSLVALGIPAMAALSNWSNWKVGQPPGA